MSGICNRGQNVLTLKKRVIPKDLLVRGPGGEEFKDIAHADALAANARLASALARLNRDALKNVGLHHSELYRIFGRNHHVDLRSDAPNAMIRPMTLPPNPPRRRDVALMLALSALAFAAVAPTLTWIEFSGGSENLNIATALEIRRSGNWLIPTLQNQPRVAKPPLTAWITASLIRRSTLEAISSPDAAVRQRGFRQLAWDVRWPALLAAALTAAAVYELGRLAGGWKLGLISSLIFITNYAFMRYARASTTDVQLALWVTLANVFLVRLLYFGQLWLGLIGAAVALGLGFLSKGPVALAQSVAPAALVGLYRGWKGGWQTRPSLFRNIGVAAAVLLVIALPWFAIVALKYPAFSVWYREITRQGATDLKGSPWSSYFTIIPDLLPWAVFLIAGLLVLYMSGGKSRQTQSSTLPGHRPVLIYMFMLVLVPILIMSMARDRKDRYLLPLIGPACVIAAYGAWLYIRMGGGANPFWRKLALAHWVIIAAEAVGFPIVAMTRLLEASAMAGGGPWLPWRLGASAACAGAAIVATGYFVQRRHSWSIVITSVLAMFLASVIFSYGYARDDGGCSELRPVAERIWREAPGAEVYTYTPGRRGPLDLSIYLNRVAPPLEEKDLAVAKSDRPQFLVVLQRKNEAEPPVGSGWRNLARFEGNDLWHLYERGR